MVYKTALKLVFLLSLGFIFTFNTGCKRKKIFSEVDSNYSEDVEFDEEFEESEEIVGVRGCQKASKYQISVVNSGNEKLNDFMSACAAKTENSPWCHQIIRPNPESKSIFFCTYGSNQQHTLIHPDEKTWQNAFTAIQLVEALQGMGVKVSLIYNWWRPEPYNRNVGGAAGRHPYGTSIDVRFETKEDQQKAHGNLCEWRKQGKIRALGYYSGTSLHLGVGDRNGNTWGKSCR